MPSLDDRQRNVENALAGPGRYVDVALALTREDNSETLLLAGGKWDKLHRRFSQYAPDEVVLVELQESQYEFFNFYSRWLAAFRDGAQAPERATRVVLMAGDRRGGKTFAGNAAVLAAVFDVPQAANKTPLITWVVSKTYRERAELEDWVLQRIPKSLYRHHQAPEHSFDFIHGPTLRLLSADDPDSLKQGRVDVAFINEPQLLQSRAVAHVILGASDLGGLVLLAANPPRGNSRGEYLFDVKDALDDELVAIAKGKKVEPLGLKYFHFESRKNKAIDQVARSSAGRIVTLVDPTLAAGDVEGEWRRPVDLAAWEYDKHRHLRSIPERPTDEITSSICSSHEYGEWAAAAGIDFQQKPHIVCAVARVFGDPDDPVFQFVGEYVGERRQSEEQFLERFEEYATPKGWTRSNLLWVGDASSSWQGPRHDFEGGERDSFTVFRADGWTIVPSQEPKANSKTGRGRNPEVADRLQLTNELLRRDRVFIDPVACPWIAECVRKAETKREDGRRRLVGNRFAHGFDAFSYLLWRLAPRAGATPSYPTDVGYGGVKSFSRSPYVSE
jgi:hypothetical protein